MELIKFFFIGLLTGLVSASNHACVSLSNQKCNIQPTFISLHPNEYSQEFHYDSFTVKLTNALEAVILSMSYLMKYVFQIKQKI